MNLISRYRNCIYGASILWVVIFHGWAITGVDYTFGIGFLHPLQSLIAAGGVGVDVFLLLSGVSLYFSFQKDSDLYRYMKKRILRVFPAIILIDGLYWFFRYALLNGDAIGFFSRITLLRFWLTGDQGVYFVSLIMVLYFVYPYFMLYLFRGPNGNSFVRLVILLALEFALIQMIYLVSPKWYSMTEIALTRIPVFTIGCWLGRGVYEGRQIGRGWWIAAIASSLLFLIVLDADILHGMQRRYLFILGGIGFAFTLGLLFYAIDEVRRCRVGGMIVRGASSLGSISLELYLSHIMVIQVLQLSPYYIKGDLFQYVIVASLAVAIAWFAKRISKRLIDWANHRARA